MGSIRIAASPTTSGSEETFDVMTGAPVITSNVSSLPEVVGDAAILIDPIDAGAIASAMAQVLGDPKLRDDLIRRGRERVKAFSWTRSVARVRQVYGELARTHTHG